MKFPKPKNEEKMFCCPGMPIVPWLALCCNVGLMVLLPVPAWIRLAIVSILIFSYAKWITPPSSSSSSLLNTHEEEVVEIDHPHLLVTD
jgi:hypothetical protein